MPQPPISTARRFEQAESRSPSCAGSGCPPAQLTAESEFRIFCFEALYSLSLISPCL